MIFSFLLFTLPHLAVPSLLQLQLLSFLPVPLHLFSESSLLFPPPERLRRLP